MIFPLILLQLICLDAFGASEQTYREMRSFAIKKYENSSVISHNYPISFSGYILYGPVAPLTYYSEAIKVASDISISEINKNHLGNCDNKKDLNIYQVSFDMLNKPHYITSKKETLGSMWGYFDPMYSAYDEATIIMASHTYDSTHVILAHEMGHYWYDRLCVNPFVIGSEEFAKKIENKYIEYYLN